MATRRKPKTPEQISMEAAQKRRLSRLDASTWGINEDQFKLQAFADMVPAREYLSDDDNVVYTTNMRQPVFMSLAKCAKPMVTEAEAIAGQALVEIYARSRNMAGSDERPPMVDYGSILKAPINDSTIDNGRRYLHLCASIPHGHPRQAIQAICHAIVMASGTVEWRGVVQEATGVKNPHIQGYILGQALKHLAEAFASEEYGEWRRDSP